MDDSLITTPAALDAALRSRHEERVEHLQRNALAPRLPTRDRVLIGLFSAFALLAICLRIFPAGDAGKVMDMLPAILPVFMAVTFAFEAVLRRKDVQIDALRTLLREANAELDSRR